MLLVNHVTKKYGKFTALEGITLEFGNGVYALLAPNGAGKTTLIKMLTTLLFPTSGEILWDGEEIAKLGEEYRDVVGYLPQEFGYYKNHSPFEFLMYLSALKGLDRKTARGKADELLALVSLQDVRNKKMRKFSGGMIQRVGIAQAMLNDPKTLILDEPTAGLDPKERVRFRNLISSLSKDRIVILSTHIVSDIETIANHVIMFKDHKLLCDDSPANICKTLAGRVFETTEITAVKEPHLTLTERQEDGHTITRFACDRETKGQFGAARLVAPNLEDVFLYIYRDEVE
jgi:ABC-type multidrug transport system ATPase subunit